VYQLRPGLFRVSTSCVPRSPFRYNSYVPGSRGSEYHLRPAVTYQVDILVIQGFPKFRFQKLFADKMERCCIDIKCKCYIKCNESTQTFGVGGDVMHNHDADREACLNRQMLNNSVKRKAMEDLCERPHKLIHKELHNQQLDTLTYKDIRNMSRNVHKARSSQLLPLPTDIEGTHEALSAVQV